MLLLLLTFNLFFFFFLFLLLSLFNFLLFLFFLNFKPIRKWFFLFPRFVRLKNNLANFGKNLKILILGVIFKPIKRNKILLFVRLLTEPIITFLIEKTSFINIIIALWLLIFQKMLNNDFVQQFLYLCLFTIKHLSIIIQTKNFSLNISFFVLLFFVLIKCLFYLALEQKDNPFCQWMELSFEKPQTVINRSSYFTDKCTTATSRGVFALDWIPPNI